jgi:hypothetical protein
MTVRIASAALACLVSAASIGVAEARIAIDVDQSAQRMTVREHGEIVAEWNVSTARLGARTPNGRYRPQSMARMHYSTLYNNAPMPYSIFYSGNYAIHGTTSVRQLGNPASAGCVRLHPENARQLYALVQRYGMRNTTITITGSTRETALARRGGGGTTRVAAAPAPRRVAARAQAQRTAARSLAPRTTARVVYAAPAPQVATGGRDFFSWLRGGVN